MPRTYKQRWNWWADKARVTGRDRRRRCHKRIIATAWGYGQIQSVSTGGAGAGIALWQAGCVRRMGPPACTREGRRCSR